MGTTLTLSCAGAKTRVKVVCDFVKNICRNLLTLLIEKPHLDRPGALWESFHL